VPRLDSRPDSTSQEGGTRDSRHNATGGAGQWWMNLPRFRSVGHPGLNRALHECRHRRAKLI
jgi:hypothetical protein